MTIGEFFTKVLAIETPEQAKAFFEGYVCGLSVSVPKAELIARENIGYCFGEGMKRERIQMWRDAVGAEHPAGRVEEMTAGELLEAGKKMAEGLKRRLG